MSNILMKFLGAAQTVTGSCYLVKTDNVQFLIDCGMFQGPDVEYRNLEEFEFNPSEIDFVLLTHTHIDHSGLLPKLVNRGFNGPIYATQHTIQLAQILLLDSAKIQEMNYKEGKPWKHVDIIDMIYNTADAENTISMFSVVSYHEEFSPVPQLKVKYVPAAHVLGAASIELELEGKKIVFSGDIGRRNHELVGGFELDHKWNPDYVVMESLYGGQVHPTRKESVGELVRAINDTLERGGSVFIPVFAVQRAQEVIHDLKIAKQSGALAQDVPVWLDSPMAQRVTNIYRAALDHSENSLFNLPQLRYSKSFRQSSKMSKKPGQIVLAGSGMADGGRIMSHLAANLKNKKNSVCFVGYQAEATLGRELTEGAKQVYIDGVVIPVKAEIHHFQGFSAHGDNNDYLAWIERYKNSNLQKVFLVHAETERSTAFQMSLQQNGISQTYVPRWKEEVALV